MRSKPQGRETLHRSLEELGRLSGLHSLPPNGALDRRKDRLQESRDGQDREDLSVAAAQAEIPRFALGPEWRTLSFPEAALSGTASLYIGLSGEGSCDVKEIVFL